jgi:TIR domain
MADIFLSYTEKDREAVRRLAESLQSAGWSVWWDRRIPAGLTWRSVLDRELQRMRCMVVLWSQHSVASEWVCEEAAEGRQLGRLVPVLIEHVRPPAGFREIQAADLVDWDGSQNFLGLRRLVEDIERLIGKPGAPEPVALKPAPQDEAPAPAPQSFPWGMSALLVVIAVGAYYGTVARKAVDPKSDPVRASLKASAPAIPASAMDAAAAIAQKQALAAAKAPVPSAAPASAAAKTTSAAAAAGVKPASGSQVSIGSRCAALRERLALGESLSSKSQVFFSQECSQ